MHRVVIAGAGFGGLATAAALRRAAAPSELEIVLVDRRVDFVMGLRKTWAALGMASLAAGLRPLRRVRDVDFVEGGIERVDPAGRSLTVDGRAIDGDALVLALGASQDMQAVPGLAEHGLNIWDREQSEPARLAIDQVVGGRRLLIGIFGMPYSCPPGPFEFALLAHDRLGPEVQVSVSSPAPIALPVVGPIESAKVERMLSDRGIRFLAKRQPVAVHAGSVEFADGSSEEFDLLLAVPVQSVPDLLVAAGLAEAGGWVMPDSRTLETSHRDVYAIGDCTVVPLANGLALPKAGIFAELQGEVVAARIIARTLGREPGAEFGGEGMCYVEAGGGRAVKVNGAFLADPVAVSISEPTSANLADKVEFERSRLAAWFAG
ncbi:MAG: FAD-dependent oxidoreductase [Chloroflexota bacterium]|nr:FAD-dependent oxidoreductase [Chloroflexota bacterium]